MASKKKRPNPFATLSTGDIIEILGRVHWYESNNNGFDDISSRFAIWLGEDTPERRKHPHLPTITDGETWSAASSRLGNPWNYRGDGINAWVMLDA